MSNYKQQMEEKAIGAWTRSTVADGRALNLAAIQKFNQNDQFLAEAIDNLSQGTEEGLDGLYLKIESVKTGIDNKIKNEADERKQADAYLQEQITENREDIDELQEKMSSVYKFKGTCETSDYSSKEADAENGDVWNLYGNTIVIPAEKAYNGQSFSACDGDNIVYIKNDTDKPGWDILHGIMKFHEIDSYEEITNDASGLVEGKAVYPLKEWKEASATNLSNFYDHRDDYSKISAFSITNYPNQFNKETANLYSPYDLHFSAGDGLEFNYNTTEGASDRYVLRLDLTKNIPNSTYFEYIKSSRYDDPVLIEEPITDLKIGKQTQNREGETDNINGNLLIINNDKKFVLLPDISEVGDFNNGEYLPFLCNHSSYGLRAGKNLMWQKIEYQDKEDIYGKVVHVAEKSTNEHIKLATADSMPTEWEEDTFYII